MRKKRRRKKRKPRKSRSKRGSRRSRGSLPANPKKGQTASIVRRGRRITFKATGRKGFGKWRIIKNEPA